jgi:amidase
MASYSDVLALDGIDQSALVRTRQVHPRELVEAAIQRIDACNSTLNAVVTTTFDTALATADKPLPASRLAGIPFLLKDLYASLAGTRQTEGSAFLRDHVADHDSDLVTRLKEAGLAIVGKTNTPEFGNAATTEGRFLGPCRNPWDPRRTAGGSSGGSAAAVAAGITAAAHGSDVGGSIRTPASCCGLFGLKPSSGRNSLGPMQRDLYSGFFQEHALTRTVRDSAALLDITSGPTAGDPYALPPPPRSFFEQTMRDPERLRIAFVPTRLDGQTIHPDCASAVEDGAALCSELGHDVEEIGPTIDFSLLTGAFYMLWCDFNAWGIDWWAARVGRAPEPDELEPLTRAVIEIGRSRSAPDHLASLLQVQKCAREIAGFFVEYDVLLTSSLAEPPPLLGRLAPPDANPLEYLHADDQFSPFSFIANATGAPGMSVPLAWNGEGLPIGCHFLGRYGDEATLFRLAGQLERARPWSQRKPPITVED